MKRITFLADHQLVEQARELARLQNRTLDDAFREWLTEYTQPVRRANDAIELIERLGKRVRANGPYTRDEMNER